MEIIEYTYSSTTIFIRFLYLNMCNTCVSCICVCVVKNMSRYNTTLHSLPTTPKICANLEHVNIYTAALKKPDYILS